jgi:hypothetical protein
MATTDLAPMPKCRECKTKLIFTPDWKLGQAKNLHCPNSKCSTYMRGKNF